MEKRLGSGSLHATDDVDALARVVDDLRRELDGLRSALRYRSVIEQAKGVLLAVTGEDPDEAFRRLVTASQRTNRRLTQVAAGVVAQAIQMPSGARPDGSRLFDEPAAGERQKQLAGAAMATADDVRELARTVLTELSDLGVATVALTAAQPDGALALLAYEGVGVENAEGWSLIPPSADVPIADAMASGRDVLLSDRHARFERYPGSRRITGSLQATASLRLVLGHRCVGVLGLGWTDPVTFDHPLRTRLRATATQLAPHIARHAHDAGGHPLSDPQAEAGYDQTMRDLLRLVDRPMALLEPVIEDELLVGLRLEHANAMAAAELGVRPGQQLLAAYPNLAASGLLDRASHVLATGQSSTDVPAVSSTAPLEQRLAAARLGRIGSLLIALWTPAPIPAAPGNTVAAAGRR